MPGEPPTAKLFTKDFQNMNSTYDKDKSKEGPHVEILIAAKGNSLSNIPGIDLMAVAKGDRDAQDTNTYDKIIFHANKQISISQNAFETKNLYHSATTYKQADTSPSQINAKMKGDAQDTNTYDKIMFHEIH